MNADMSWGIACEPERGVGICGEELVFIEDAYTGIED
jgi:hypothetical protein